MPYHSHFYSGITTFDHGHVHAYEGETSLAPTGATHVHYIQGITTYDNGHTHAYSITTGINIPTADGGHTHYIDGATEIANEHIHNIINYTSSNE
jgi:hypothetical protein